MKIENKYIETLIKKAEAIEKELKDKDVCDMRLEIWSKINNLLGYISVLKKNNENKIIQKKV